MQHAKWGLTNGTTLGQTNTNRDHKLYEIENKRAAQVGGKSGQARSGYREIGTMWTPQKKH